MFSKASSGGSKRSVRSALLQKIKPSLGSRRPSLVQKGGPTDSKYKLRESVLDIQQEELRRLTKVSRTGYDSAITSEGGSGTIFPSSWSVEEAQNFHKHVSFVDYDLVNQRTRKSVVQGRFNVLIHDAIVNYAPVGISSLMPNQLYSFLKAECRNPAVLSYAASLVVEHSANASHATRILNARHQFNFTKHYEEASLTASDILYFQYISGRRLSFDTGSGKKSNGVGRGDSGEEVDSTGQDHWEATQSVFNEAAGVEGNHSPVDLSFAAQTLPKRPLSFNVDTYFSGVPFHVLLANCPYLKAFGGRLNYMRLIKPLGRHYKPDNNKFGNSAATKDDIPSSTPKEAKTVPLSSDTPSPQETEHQKKRALSSGSKRVVENLPEEEEGAMILQNGVEGARMLLDAFRKNSALERALGYDEINDLPILKHARHRPQNPYNLDLSGPLSIRHDNNTPDSTDPNSLPPGPLTKFKKNKNASRTQTTTMNNARLQARGGILGALSASEDTALMSFYGTHYGSGVDGTHSAAEVAVGGDTKEEEEDDPFAGMTDEEILGIELRHQQPSSTQADTFIMSGNLPWQVAREERRPKGVSGSKEGVYHGGAVAPPAQHTISTILLDDDDSQDASTPSLHTATASSESHPTGSASANVDNEDDDDTTPPNVFDPDFDAYHAHTSAMPIPPEREMYLTETDTQSRMLDGHHVPADDIAYSNKFYTIVDGNAVRPDGSIVGGRLSANGGEYDPLRSTQGLTEEEAMKVRRGAEGWKYSGEFGDDPLGDNRATDNNTTNTHTAGNTSSSSSIPNDARNTSSEAPPKNKERSSRILDEGEEEFLADAEGALLEGKAVVVGLAKYEFKQSSAWDPTIRTGPDSIAFGYSDMPTRKIAHDKWRRHTYKINH